MIFGVLKDIKEGENRVICTPVEVATIVSAGHTVYVQKGAGAGAGFPDEKYAAAGAIIADTAAAEDVERVVNAGGFSGDACRLECRTVFGADDEVFKGVFRQAVALGTGCLGLFLPGGGGSGRRCGSCGNVFGFSGFFFSGFVSGNQFPGIVDPFKIGQSLGEDIVIVILDHHGEEFISHAQHDFIIFG